MPSLSPPPTHREPRSAFDAAWRFAVGFAVSQPAGMLLLGFAFGREIPFRSVGEWTAYAAAVVLSGASVGVLWFRAGRRPAGSWRREWAHVSLGLVGFTLLTASPSLAWASLPVWIAGSACASMLFGAAIAWFGRAFGPNSGI